MKQNNETSYNCFKWGREGVEEGDGGGNLTNVQCKAIGNWHNESPLYNEYMLIKMKIFKSINTEEKSDEKKIILAPIN
jgi:hypothetical protein